MYESACLARAQELTALGRAARRAADPAAHRGQQDGEEAAGSLRLSAHRPLEGHARHGIRLPRGRELPHRRGRKAISAEAGMKSPWASEPYPTTGAYSVVSVRGSTVTLRGLQSGQTIRLSYLGEATDRGRNRRQSAKTERQSEDSINHHEKEGHHHHCRRAGWRRWRSLAYPQMAGARRLRPSW